MVLFEDFSRKRGYSRGPRYSETKKSKPCKCENCNFDNLNRFLKKTMSLCVQKYQVNISCTKFEIKT